MIDVLYYISLVFPVVLVWPLKVKAWKKRFKNLMHLNTLGIANSFSFPIVVQSWLRIFILKLFQEG